MSVPEGRNSAGACATGFRAPQYRCNVISNFWIGTRRTLYTILPDNYPRTGVTNCRPLIILLGPPRFPGRDQQGHRCSQANADCCRPWAWQIRSVQKLALFLFSCWPPSCLKQWNRVRPGQGAGQSQPDLHRPGTNAWAIRQELNPPADAARTATQFTPTDECVVRVSVGGVQNRRGDGHGAGATAGPARAPAARREASSQCWLWASRI